MVMRLSMRKARTLVAVYSHPFHVDTVSDIETMYTETLRAIGDKGRLAGYFYIDLDRDRRGGIYTCTYKLSLRITDDDILELGRITNISLNNHELRIDVLDGGFRYAVILTAED